jgi:hypothetical protein
MISSLDLPHLRASLISDVGGDLARLVAAVEIILVVRVVAAAVRDGSLIQRLRIKRKI